MIRPASAHRGPGQFMGTVRNAPAGGARRTSKADSWDRRVARSGRPFQPARSQSVSAGDWQGAIQFCQRITCKAVIRRITLLKQYSKRWASTAPMGAPAGEGIHGRPRCAAVPAMRSVAAVKQRLDKVLVATVGDGAAGSGQRDRALLNLMPRALAWSSLSLTQATSRWTSTLQGMTLALTSMLKRL